MGFLDPREPVNTWSHGLWLLLALPGMVLLLWRSRGSRGKQVSLFIYGLSLVFCAAASSLYHCVQASADRIATFALMDYIGIYFLIAGSYTAIGWNILRGRWRQGILSVVWLWALVGTALRLSGVALPPWLSTGLYLIMGWGSLFCYVEITRRLPFRILLPIPLGGLLYSMGAVCNLLGRPVLWPGVFQAHELFHVLVVAGSLAHYWFVLTVVVPYSDEPGMFRNDSISRVLPPAYGANGAPGLVRDSSRGLA